MAIYPPQLRITGKVFFDYWLTDLNIRYTHYCDNLYLIYVLKFGCPLGVEVALAVPPI